MKRRQADINRPELSTAIRELRRTRDVTLCDLGEALKIDHSYLSRIELGSKPCPPALAARIADALGAPREHLVRLALEQLIPDLDLEISVRRRSQPDACSPPSVATEACS